MKLPKFLHFLIPVAKVPVPVRPISREKHQWQLVSRGYASPVRSFEGLDSSKLEPKLLEKMALGVTTYLWECSLTGDTKVREILGSDVPTLEDILVKAHTYGPQIVKNEAGETFHITHHIPVIDPRTLPVRKA